MRVYIRLEGFSEEGERVSAHLEPCRHSGWQRLSGARHHPVSGISLRRSHNRSFSTLLILILNGFSIGLLFEFWVTSNITSG